MRRAWVLASGLAAVVFGCGGHSDPPPNCPLDLPAACPPTVPSFAADVAPIFSSICANCHAAGKPKRDVPLDNYARIKARAGTVLSQIYDCIMPPAGSPAAINEAQRIILMTWLVCDSPNN